MCDFLKKRMWYNNNNKKPFLRSISGALNAPLRFLSIVGCLLNLHPLFGAKSANSDDRNQVQTLLVCGPISAITRGNPPKDASSCEPAFLCRLAPFCIQKFPPSLGMFSAWEGFGEEVEKMIRYRAFSFQGTNVKIQALRNQTQHDSVSEINEIERKARNP